MLKYLVVFLSLSSAFAGQISGAVRFSSEVSYDLELLQSGKYNSPPSIVVADFNRDGIPDAAVSAKHSVVILLGRGNGAVSLGSSQTVPSPGFLISADFNHDGKPDILVLHQFSPDVTILLGNGDGTLAAPATVQSGISDVVSAAIGDLNGDGIPDVLLAGYEYPATGQIQPLFGNGDGTFRTGIVTTVSSTYSCSSVVLGSFHRGSHLDAALACGSIFELSGNGDGTFGTAQALSSTTTATYIAAADLNGDGHLDLVYDEIDGSRSKLNVLAGTGAG